MKKVVQPVTRQSGRFQMPEIKPGHYEISVAVEALESEQDITRLGNLVVQH
jgi:hypothetical protein